MSAFSLPSQAQGQKGRREQVVHDLVVWLETGRAARVRVGLVERAYWTEVLCGPQEELQESLRELETGENGEAGCMQHGVSA